MLNQKLNQKLNRYFSMISAFMLLLMSHLAIATDQARVLMVVSSYGVEQGETQPGYEFDEFSKAYLVFKANGFAVDIASPTGGAVEADKYDPTKPYNKTVLTDTVVMAQLANTLATKTLNASDYNAVFVVGGKGAMFDLPKDLALQQLIASIYEDKGTVAAVCHGPAALVDVKLADGSYLVDGKAVNGFTNVEEQMFGKKWMPHFEFMLEDKLNERGGKFEKSAMMLSHVAEDDRLITGQNPTSTSAAAEALVRSLGYTPVARQPYQDEATFAVIARVLNNDISAVTELTVNSAQYALPMVGMYGFYHAKSAQTNKQLKQALNLMEIAQDEINNPALDAQISKTKALLAKNN